MSLADNILMPHPRKVLAALQKVRRARFENLFPGLLQKTREWMETDQFRLRYEFTNYSTSGHAMFAPASVEYEMREMSGVTESDFTQERSDMIWREAIILWNEYNRAKC